MAKIITPEELAEVVTKMLAGEDGPDDKDTYQSFLNDIAEVVCDYAGGEVGSVSLDKNDPNHDWLIAIRGNDSVPEDGGIWSNYDPEGEL